MHQQELSIWNRLRRIVSIHKIVWMDPVLGGLSDKVGLGAACSCVTCDRFAARSDEVVELGEFNDELVV